jgi:DNA repair photolyase
MEAKNVVASEINTVRYTAVEARSVLNRSGLADYSVNGYTGCAHGCVYCYARFASRFSHPNQPWGSFVDIKANAPDMLAREVKRRPAGHVMLSSVCDAWQPVEKDALITRRCLEILVRYRYEISALTKSALSRRDLDLLAAGRADFGVTVTTLDPYLARLIEPGASPPRERLAVLAEAKSKGISTYAFVGPLLPFLSDTEDNIRSLLKHIRDIGVDHFYLDKLNLRYGVWPALLKLLREHYPALLAGYRKIFFENATKMAYLSDLSTRARRVAGELGLADKMRLCL